MNFEEGHKCLKENKKQAWCGKSDDVKDRRGLRFGGHTDQGLNCLCLLLSERGKGLPVANCVACVKLGSTHGC